MPKIDLDEFASEVRVRELRLDDYPDLIEMQKLCFPNMDAWTKRHFESQVTQFPDGQLCVEYDGKVVASASSLIVDSEDYSAWHDWKEISDDGLIRNHNDAGDTLYGIEMMVHPEYRGLRLSRRLYDARKQLARSRNLSRIVIGGRLPGYHAHADRLTASEYVEEVMRKSLFDPVLTAQLANGFDLKRLIPGYLPEDEKSKGYATFLEWVNLDYVPPRRRSFRAVSLVRLAVVQWRVRAIDSFEEFEQQCRFFLDTAGEYHADFIVFPELFTTQLLSLVPSRRPGEAARQLAEFTPRYLDLFRDLAIEFNVNVVGGSQFVQEGDKLLNIAYLFRRDGSIEQQPKLHITPSERKWWGVQGGDGLRVFETDRGKVAILICYDVEFPELARAAAGQGADILFVPFNTDVRSSYLRVRVCAQARAIENEVYVAASGVVGNLPFVDNADIHYAQSGVFTPSDVTFERDAIAAECTPNIETIVFADVDIEQLHRARKGGAVTNWKDRRKDLYGLRFRTDDETIEF